MKNLLFIILVILGLASCSPAYFPPKINAPLLVEEGEVKLNADINIGSLNLQGSTAISDNFAIAGSFSGYSVKTSESSTLSDGSAIGFQFDVMPGYYVPFGDYGVFEIYAGYGAGITNSEVVNGLLHRLMIQPSLGFVGERYEVAFSCRISRVMIPASAITSENPNESYADTFFEPALTFRRGFGALKFTSQIGLSIPSSVYKEEPGLDLSTISINNIEPDPVFIEWVPIIITVGIQYTIPGF